MFMCKRSVHVYQIEAFSQQRNGIKGPNVNGETYLQVNVFWVVFF